MLALYGHPFSSYTWKVLIALYASNLDFDYRVVDPDHPDHMTTVARAGPWGKFPVLDDNDRLIFESTAIIDYIQLHHAGATRFVPEDPDAAIDVRMIDRVFDNYVMAPMQAVVEEHIRAPQAPDLIRIGEAKARLQSSYAWLEGWLESYSYPGQQVTLVECAAAPALFYADWVERIGDAHPRLARWRAHLLALHWVKRCVDEARPYRAYFPPGAPDRD